MHFTAGKEGFAARIALIEDLGAHRDIHIEPAADPASRLVMRVAAGAPRLSPGDRATIAFRQGEGHLFDPSGQRLM